MAHKPTALENRAMTLLKQQFKHDDHYPSPRQYDALADILMCLDRMRTRKTFSKVFLSAIDPGVGKTSALIAYVQAFLEHDPKPELGMLICINSWREVETLCLKLKHLSKSIAIWAPDACPFGSSKMVERHGVTGAVTASDMAQDRLSAPILITTHERISRQVLKYGSDQTATSLHYLGRPRAIKTWDEAWVPADPVTINCNLIHDVMVPINQISQDAYSTLSTFLEDAQKRQDGDRLLFPDLKKMGVTFNTVEDYFANSSEGENAIERRKELLYACLMASGKHVAVCNENGYGNTVLTFTDSSPFALAPLLVLDASGRVRELYSDLVDRRVIQPLREGEKEYDPLDVYLWQRRAGKGVFNSKKTSEYLEIVNEIVKLIRTKSNSERFLIVHHMEKIHPRHPVEDISKLIFERLKPEEKFVQAGKFKGQERVSAIHWGQHRATNDFADYSNIVIAGLLFLRQPDYVALKRIALGARPEDEIEITKQHVAQFRLGEHRQNLLQAGCRIRVRKCDGAKCQPASMYIIAPANSGITSVIFDTFPGASDIQSWGPEDAPAALTAVQAAALAYLRKWAKDLPHDPRIRFAPVFKALGYSDGSNFKRDVRLNPIFNEMLEEIGIKEDRSRRNATAWVIYDRDLVPEKSAEEYGFAAA